MAFIARVGQAPGTVLLLKQGRVRIRNFDGHILESAVPEREDVVVLKVVLVLAVHPAGLAGLLLVFIVSDSRDVDKEASFGIDPARVDNVEPVVGGGVQVMRVHFDHVVAADVGARDVEVMHRHVVVAGKIVHALLRHLNVNVRVPRHDLAIPPPAQQRAVHDPRLRTNVVHSGQVSLDEGCQVGKAVVVRQGRLGEAAIVMRVELWKCKLGGGWSHGTVAAPYSRLVEVLVDGITTLSAVVLLVLRLDAQEVGVSSPYRIACRSGCGMYVAKQAESGNERA